MDAAALPGEAHLIAAFGSPAGIFFWAALPPKPNQRALLAFTPRSIPPSIVLRMPGPAEFPLGGADTDDNGAFQLAPPGSPARGFFFARPRNLDPLQHSLDRRSGPLDRPPRPYPGVARSMEPSPRRLALAGIFFRSRASGQRRSAQ
jgi:hypothetical protein